MRRKKRISFTRQRREREKEKCFITRGIWGKSGKGVKRLSKASFISERRESGLVSRRGQVVARRADSKQMSEIRDKRCTMPSIRDRTVIASVSSILIIHALKYLRISSSQFLPRSSLVSLSLSFSPEEESLENDIRREAWRYVPSFPFRIGRQRK